MALTENVISTQGYQTLPEGWDTYSGNRKFKYLSSLWASAEGKLFASQENAERYERRTKRWLDILALKVPDRVPNNLKINAFILENAGLKPINAFYDAEKTAEAIYKFHKDFECEYSRSMFSLPGKTLDLLNCKLIRWPGGTLPEDTQFQYVEDEYMRKDEYDELIGNPEAFLLRKYLGRIFGSLKGLENLPTLFHAVEAVGFPSLLSAFAGGPLRKAMETILLAAGQFEEHFTHFRAVGTKIMADFGAPKTVGGGVFAPFDIIGDTLRCTKEIMMDMYRNPDKLIAACDAVLPFCVRMATESAVAARCPFVGIPLHKGADGFMSQEQFKTFYWPSLKSLLLQLINAGLVPVPFVEGSYNKRLDLIAESGLPAGRTMWHFDRTDMAAAKEKIGSFACIGGNVPASLFAVGTPEMIEAYCRDLISISGRGGGFFLAPGAVIDHAKRDVLCAYLAVTQKYGKYQ